MWWDAVLIDFDNTLADTRPLEPLREECRRNRTWTRYFQRVPEAEPVKTAAGEPVVALCEALTQLKVPHAIVSNSPKGAVDAWFTGRGYKQPPTFGAVGKPGTSGLLDACRALGVPAAREAAVLLIDDGFDGARAGFQAGIWTGTVVRETDLNEPPDYFIPTLAAVLDTDQLIHLAGDKDRHGSPGLLRVELEDSSLFVAGRHRITSDPLSDSLRAKPAGAWPEHLYGLALRVVSAAIAGPEADCWIITQIPAHRGKPDRFDQLLDAVADELGIEHARLLRYTRDTRHQRGLSAAGRATNLDGAMESDVNLELAGVVVFDDVVTTGSTMLEAARALWDRGPDAVRCAAIAKTAFSRPGTPGQWAIPDVGVIWRGIHSHGAPSILSITTVVDMERHTVNYARFTGHNSLGQVILYLPHDRFSWDKKAPVLEATIRAARRDTPRLVLERSRDTSDTVQYWAAGQAMASAPGSGHPTFILVDRAVVRYLGDPQFVELELATRQARGNLARDGRDG